MSISNMRTVSPVQTFFGAGSSRIAGKIVTGMNVSKVLLVCDQGVRSFGLADAAIESMEELNVEVVVFDGVVPDPPVQMVDELASFCRESGCQCVVGVGGGSVLDTGKCVALLQTNPGSIRAYAEDPGKPRTKGIPFIAIPTTAGTGSEVTSGAVVTMPDSGVKVGLNAPDLFATAALVDPLLTLGLPKSSTANTAMDAFSHAVEAMLSGIGNPVCDILSLEAIRLISENLRAVTQNGKNLEARTNVMLAAYLGGMALNDGACSFGHAIAHTVGARYHIPHGAVCALSIPMTIEFYAEAFPEKIRRIAQAMHVDLDGCADAKTCAAIVADAVRSLNRDVGIRPLRELGIPYEELPQLSRDILNDACVQVIHLTLPEAVVSDADFLIPLQKEYVRK